MKKILLIAAALLLASSCVAQNTSVTATVTSPNGYVWAQATYTVTLVPYVIGSISLLNGAQFTQTYSGTLNSSGQLSITLADNNIVTPSGSQWRFNLCAAAGVPCIQAQTTITGTSMSLTALLSSLAPNPYNNVIPNPQPGTATIKPFPSNAAGIVVVANTNQTSPLAIFAKPTGSLGLAITPSCILFSDASSQCTAATFNGLAPPASTGSLLYASGANVWSALGIGAANSILTYNGTLPGWSSSVISSINDTGGQVFNVKAYGATGNGSTNDLTSVQNAINAASTAGGGQVYFPPGTYLLGNVTLPSSVFLVCASPGSTILESPAGGNYGLITASNAHDVGIFNCQLNGNQTGSAASGYNFAFENVQRGWFVNTYSHDGGSSDLGIDINSASGSSGIYVLDSVFTNTHNVIIANIQTGDGASDIHFIGNTINENLSGQMMFGGDGITNSVLADDTFYGTSSVAAGIQLEATSHNVTNVQLSNIKIEGVGGSQSALLLTETAGNSISGITGSNIQFINCGRGFSINNFNGNGSGTVSDISVNGLHVIGTSTYAAVYVWNHTGGTFQNIHLSGVSINGCGLGDGNGCIVLSGAMTGVQIDGAQILNVPSGAYPIYQTTISNLVSVGNVSFTGGTGALTNQYTNLMGFLTGNATVGGSCENGAIYSNVLGTSGSTLYTCVAGAWTDIK